MVKQQEDTLVARYEMLGDAFQVKVVRLRKLFFVLLMPHTKV